MEWVETTGRTIEEAKEAALDQLGVDDREAEFEIVEEPKPGLFGRVKGQARVRARVRPKTPPSRDDRRRRPAKSKDKSGDKPNAADAQRSTPFTTDADDAPAKATAQPVATSRPAVDGERNGSSRRGGRTESSEPTGPRLDSEVAAREAKLFLEGIVGQFGVVATVEIETDESGDLSATITGEQLGRLIGPRGGVINAIEELTRTRLQHVAEGGSTPRFKVDVGDYRGGRRATLEVLVDDVVERVRTTGKPHLLDVVVASERKLVHDRVAESATDLSTHSEGEDPTRRVMISPA